MKAWIIAGVLIGILVIAALGVVSFVKADEQTAKQTKSTAPLCSGCGNKCTAENNCGLATCGAISGKSCGCGK